MLFCLLKVLLPAGQHDFCVCQQNAISAGVNIKAFVMHTSCRYRIEQELGTEIKPIPPIIEKDLYCS